MSITSISRSLDCSVLLSLCFECGGVVFLAFRILIVLIFPFHGVFLNFSSSLDNVRKTASLWNRGLGVTCLSRFCTSQVVFGFFSTVSFYPTKRVTTYSGEWVIIRSGALGISPSFPLKFSLDSSISLYFEPDTTSYREH